MKVGIMGGTFDPIHFGHLRTAQEVCEHYNLDKIFFIPSAIPPHKNNINIASSKDRENMVHMAISNNPYFDISDIEIKRRGKSYTIETLNEFNKNFSTNIEIFFIVGIDAFLEIDTWKSYKQLFDHASFIVMTRPFFFKAQNENISGYINQLKNLEEYILNIISNKYIFNKADSLFMHSKKKTIFFIRVTCLEISSTKIRALVSKGKSIKYLVPESISDYIYKNRLYGIY